jgi:hypothetical protein
MLAISIANNAIIVFLCRRVIIEKAIQMAYSNQTLFQSEFEKIFNTDYSDDDGKVTKAVLSAIVLKVESLIDRQLELESDLKKAREELLIAAGKEIDTARSCDKQLAEQISKCAN